MPAECRKHTFSICLAVIIAMFCTFRESARACNFTCPYLCPQVTTGPAMETWIAPDFEVEQECLNPSGSTNWTVNNWINYLSGPPDPRIWADGLDVDQVVDKIWLVGDPCNGIPCTVWGWGDPWLGYGGQIDITWSMPNGPPDLTTPGSYTFRATYTEIPYGYDWWGCNLTAIDSPVTRDLTVTVVPRGKCCQVVEGLLIGNCDITTSAACLERNTTSPPQYSFEGGGPCCETGACWEILGNPSRCVNGATSECCDAWPGDQFVPGKTCCGDTDDGEWHRADPTADCANNSPNELLLTLEDSCGNNIKVYCEYGYYSYKYNGFEFGMCPYRCGKNVLRYQMSSDQRRFLVVYHRTRDDHEHTLGGKTCDQGTSGKEDWTLHEYDCICGCAVLDRWRCCEGDSTPASWYSCAADSDCE